MAEQTDDLVILDHYVDGKKRSIEVRQAPISTVIDAVLLVELEYCPRNAGPDGRVWFDGDVLHIHAIGAAYRYRVDRRAEPWRFGEYRMRLLQPGEA